MPTEPTSQPTNIPTTWRTEAAYMTALAVVGLLGVIDAPLLACIAAGHVLTHIKHNRLATAVGEALEELT